MGELIEASSSDIDFQKGVCAVCKKKQVARWCDYIIKYNHAITFFRRYQDFAEANRRGAMYQTCDLPMCADCAHNVSLDHDLCPHHKMLQDNARLPDEYQRQRQQREKTMMLQRHLEQAEDAASVKNSKNGSNQMTLFD